MFLCQKWDHANKLLKESPKIFLHLQIKFLKKSWGYPYQEPQKHREKNENVKN